MTWQTNLPGRHVPPHQLPLQDRRWPRIDHDQKLVHAQEVVVEVPRRLKETAFRSEAVDPTVLHHDAPNAERTRGGDDQGRDDHGHAIARHRPGQPQQGG